MLVGLSNDGNRVIARDAIRDDKFFCPSCNEPLVLKKGEIKIHHFAHKADSTCLYAGETLEHLSTKLQIYDALLKYSRVNNSQLETNVGNIRPDIVFDLANNCGVDRIGIEIQNSPIELTDIRRRNAEYAKLNMAVLWMLPNTLIPKFNKNTKDYKVMECDTAEWQRNIHNLYDEKIYFYVEHLSVFPVHFYNVTREYSDKFIKEHPYIKQNVELVRKKGARFYWKNLNLLDDFCAKKINDNLLWTDDYGLWWNNKNVESEDR
jgi:competence protein CoiA